MRRHLARALIFSAQLAEIVSAGVVRCGYMDEKIKSFVEFRDRLASVTERMEQLIKDYPGDSFLESILRQLKHVAEWTAEGRAPAKEQIEKLSFGTMASKAVADTDDECARMLYSLSYFLRHWPTAG